MSSEEAIVGAITVVMIIGLVFVLAWIMTADVNDDDLDDDF